MIINVLSSPRNISTALMYAFAHRNDTEVMDEPFYAYYLNSTSTVHPGQNEILRSQPHSVEEIFGWIDESTQKKPQLFIKNMAHHMVMEDVSFLKSYGNFFLIRNPKQQIASFAQVIDQPQMSDIGIKRQFELYQYLKPFQDCVVVDSGELLKNPKLILQKLCAALGLSDQSEQMTTWEPTQLKADGVWAKYWYRNVHQSSGFSPQKTSERPLP